MTSLERVLAVMNGQIPDRLPVIPQAFMFSAFTSGYHIGEINRSPAKMADAHRICQEKYGYDGCVIDVDDATLAEACGAKVIFRKENVAIVDEKAPVLDSLEEIDDLRLPDPLKDGRCCEWLETSQRLMEMIGDHVFIMGRADPGAFSLLTLLRGTQNFMMDLLTENEDVIFHALEWATEAHTRFARAQLMTGVHSSSMGDSYAGQSLVSPAIYKKFAYPYEKNVVENLQDLEGYYSIHICGKADQIIDHMGMTGADILELDWEVDMGEARKRLPEKTVIMGNINPSSPLVFGKPEEVDLQVRDLIRFTKGKGLIISSGCAMGENTKPENMRAMVNAAKRYGTYEQLCEMQK